MKLLNIILLAAAVAIIGSCKDKKHVNTDIITTDYEIPQPVAPIAMDTASKHFDATTASGQPYGIDIVRMPADTLPMVADAIGQKYIDNRVSVTITKGNGEQVFARKFTKASFAEWLNDDYRTNALLQDITFYGAEKDNLVLTAVVNAPDAAEDESINLMLTVSSKGDLSVEPFDDDQRDDLKQQDLNQ
mgnify:CR=1 FL=1